MAASAAATPTTTSPDAAIAAQARRERFGRSRDRAGRRPVGAATSPGSGRRARGSVRNAAGTGLLARVGATAAGTRGPKVASTGGAATGGAGLSISWLGGSAGEADATPTVSPESGTTPGGTGLRAVSCAGAGGSVAPVDSEVSGRQDPEGRPSLPDREDFCRGGDGGAETRDAPALLVGAGGEEGDDSLVGRGRDPAAGIGDPAARSGRDAASGTADPAVGFGGGADSGAGDGFGRRRDAATGLEDDEASGDADPLIGSGGGGVAARASAPLRGAGALVGPAEAPLFERAAPATSLRGLRWRRNCHSAASNRLVSAAHAGQRSRWR